MSLEQEVQNTIELLNPWWKGESLELGVERTRYLKRLFKMMDSGKISFVVGPRRVGKTVLMFQAITKLLERGVNRSKILFLSLDNINLRELDVYSYVLSGDFEYLFFDEVQYYDKFEQLLKSLFDLTKGKYNIVGSGSSYKMISSQKGLLTGRNLVMEMLPLSYPEYIKFKESEVDPEEYLEIGGYPEYVLSKNPNYLSELVKDVITKDIVNIHKIRNEQALLEILKIIAKQIGCKSSFQKISQVVGVSDDTVKSYLSYLKEARLVEFISKYSESRQKMVYSQKKFYFMDTGVRNSLTGFEDFGALVESAVLMELIRRYGREKIYYLQNERGREVDFLVKLSPNEAMLVEAKYSKFKERILKKLPSLFFKERIYNLKLVKRVVVTDSVDEELELEGGGVELVSLRSFLSK